MILRSGRFTGIDYPSIDFDHSSNEWMKNNTKCPKCNVKI